MGFSIFIKWYMDGVDNVNLNECLFVGGYGYWKVYRLRITKICLKEALLKA